MTIENKEFVDFITTNKVGILIEGCGLGDKIQYTHLPENLYKNFGIKLYDPYKYWVFDKNPFVRRDENPNQIVILDKLFSIPEDQRGTIYGRQSFSRPDKHCKILGIKNFIRHFSLYDQNEQNINYKRIVLHIGPGKSTAGEMPNFVVDKIKSNYKNFEIIQIGADSDKNMNLIDKRGSSIEEMVSLIRDSFLFIGVNSGPMNIANCYPNVIKKIVITDQNNDIPHYRISYDDFLSNEFIPQKHYGMPPHINTENWIDFNCMYYNTTENDMGVTYSYTKI